MHVLTAAWVGTGSPAAPGATSGPCARCGREDDGLVPTRHVISKQFTGFDGWADPSGCGLCAVCAWGYSTASLRSATHLVTRSPASMRQLSRVEVAGLLHSGTLETDLALVVPLRPGRKHILPSAVWGRVNVDDAQLSWTARDAGLLQLIARLRELGFGSRMLTAAAPPFPVMNRLDRSCWAEVLAAWGQLGPWRAPDNPWLTLALHVTTPTSKESPS